MKIFTSFVALYALLLVPPAHAYIDPGTAGIILQAIIGGAVAAFAVLANYWRRIKAFFARLLHHKDNSSEEDEHDSNQP